MTTMPSDDKRRDTSFVIESAEVFTPLFERPSSYEELGKVMASPTYRALVDRMNDRLNGA
jgi:hypothetical protein